MVRPAQSTRFAVGGAYSISVKGVPTQKLWETVVDVDATPVFLRSVVSVERLDGSRKGSPLQVGTRWREFRRYRGKDMPMIKTVTSVSTSDGHGGGSAYPRTFAVSVNFGDNGADYAKMANTSSIIVATDPVDDSSPVLAGTFVAVPAGWWFKLNMLLFGRTIRKRTGEQFREELNDIATEALRRAKDASASD